MLPAGPDSQCRLLNFDIRWAYALQKARNTVIRGILYSSLIPIQRKGRNV